MTHDELFERAVDCARMAREYAARHDGETTSEAYSRAGELFLKLAAHERSRPKPPPPPPGRDTLDH